MRTCGLRKGAAMQLFAGGPPEAVSEAPAAEGTPGRFPKRRVPSGRAPKGRGPRGRIPERWRVGWRPRPSLTEAFCGGCLLRGG